MAKQIDVMVADASHEVYVDKILDTIREAAKVRGTGIADRMSVCTEVSSNCTVAGFHLTLDSFSVKRQFIANFTYLCKQYD